METDMHERFEGRVRRYDCHGKGGLFFGIALIAAGTLFLLDRFGVMPLDQPWRLWPAVLAVFGVARIAFARGARDVLKGLLLLALAGWLYACLEQLWGWTFATTWPIILIAVGIKAVAGGILGTRRHSHKESEQ
jgi:hypothetical protein